ncbi:Ldh family oxidoreductase [Tautonia sociabilis]|uniref:Ldh family oxidoreductase n=1 Tax=Tautonia sociabilis TaxID=2080755 RepID=UPI001315579E|nr:Ldh family oxidoreductase [Tautonia sociabilis]
MSQSHRYRPEELRRLATDLLSRAGLARERASAMARLLLWYDAVAAHEFGIASLVTWLARLERGEFDANQEGRVGPEHASTAVLESKRGLPPLVLARAAVIASQKARDVGVGMVRVVGLPEELGPAAAIAADLAIGPYAGAVLGPGSAQAAAVPSAEGVPVVYDSTLGAGEEGGPPEGAIDRLAPWALLAGGEDVLVVAVAVAAFESLVSFHRRVASAIAGKGERPGWIFPELWQARREAIQHAGIPLAADTLRAIRERADSAGVAFPGPVG